MATYLVTGGAGFIGSHLTTRFVEQGHSVRVVDNFNTGLRENLAHLGSAFEMIEGDVTDADLMARAASGVDVIFHHAAQASVPRSIEFPAETHHACATGTVIVLDAARLAGVKRVVYAASSSAYGNQPELPKHEGQLPQVPSPYAAAKLAGEIYCEAFAACYELETVRLRYFNVFGPRQEPDSPYAAVIPLFVSALLEGRQPTIFGDGSQTRDFTYIDNIVKANELAADASGVSGKVYNVATGHSITVLEMLKEICRLLGKPYNPNFVPARAGDVLHSSADCSAARRDLGYAVEIDFYEGLQKTVEAYLERAGMCGDVSSE